MSPPPDFICLGVHKSGTSWLYHCLFEHPEIFITDKIDYFYRADRFAKGESWYARFFKERKEKITGDLSTVYLFNQKPNQPESTAERIYKHNPNTKLIVLLRNPIDRAYAHYLQDIKIGHIPISYTFEKAIKENPNILFWGKYKTHLQRYFRYFNAGDMFFVVFEDIKNNPERVLQELYSYLEVTPDFVPKHIFKKVNVSRIPGNQKIEKYKRKLSHSLKKSKVGKKLWWQLKQKGWVSVFDALNSNKKQPTQLTNTETRNQLYQYFKEDIGFVKTVLNKPEIDWK